MDKKGIQPKPSRYILLDTNVISSFSNKELGDKIMESLKKAYELGYGIAISQYTIYEILNEASFEKEQAMLEVLRGVKHYYVRKDDLIAAAHIASLYKEEDIPMNQINDGDRIIAATAIMTNSLILTTNARDFPQPFFREIHRENLEYQNKKVTSCKMFYYMDPQIEYINKCHQERLAPYKEKIEKKIKNLSYIQETSVAKFVKKK